MKKFLILSILACFASAEVISIKVSKYEPIYETQNICPQNQDENNILGSVAGAAVGGVIGHQFGKGRGKTAATIGGAVIGGIAGNRVQENLKEGCESKKVLTGYRHIGYYNGDEYELISDRKLDTMKIEI